MPITHYAGNDDGTADRPEPAHAPQPSADALALRQAELENRALRERMRAVEHALRCAHRVIEPYVARTIGGGSRHEK